MLKNWTNSLKTCYNEHMLKGNKVFIGQFKPKQKVRCAVSGKIFGPKANRKMGYIVQHNSDNGIRSYRVYSKKEAAELKKQIEQGLK
jgi:hypothetical protein